MAQIGDSDFVTLVQFATNTAPAGHGFGPRKVFIRCVYERLKIDPRFRQMSLESFKRRLLAAAKRGELRLARADLVSAMDPHDVALSHLAAPGADYHFVERT